jgi:periplasmic divalent cation tolerance protein
MRNRDIDSDQPMLVYVTADSSDEAIAIGEALVADRLVACANIIPGMFSVYEWRGEVCHGEETVLIVKTRRSLVPDVSRRIQDLHGYDCPCVVALPIEGGNPEFLSWIVDQTERTQLA